MVPLGNSDIKRNNLTKEDIHEFAKLTASSIDDCVREIDQLIEAKGAKEKELADLVEAEELIPVEDKIRNQRVKDRIRKDIRDLDKNIEVVTERGLILERSCDVNQEVASQLEGKEVNYRTTHRLAEKGDIEEDVKELKSRLASKEKRQAAAGDSRIKKLIRWLLAIAAIIIIILLLLRRCGGIGSIKHTVYKVIGLGSGDSESDGTGTSESVKLGFGNESSDKDGEGDDTGKSSRSVFGIGDNPDEGDEDGEGTSERNKFGFGNEASGKDGEDDDTGKSSKSVFGIGDNPDEDDEDGEGTSEHNKLGFGKNGSRKSYGTGDDDSGKRRNQVSSDEWKRNYTGKIVRDDMITIPYKDPAVPFDDMEIEYYLLEGDFASGFNTITGSLLDSFLGPRNVTLDEIVAAYSQDHGVEEDKTPPAPPSIAEQLAKEDERRANKLAPEDKFYSIDIANKGTSKKEIIEKMTKESPYVSMESEGVPIDISAGLLPYSLDMKNDGGPDDSLWPPQSPVGWTAGIDVAGHYKVINDENTSVGVGLRVGGYTDPLAIASGDTVPLNVPVMAEVKGKFGGFETYAGLGVMAGLDARSWNVGGVGINPAAELGIGFNTPIAADDHSSLSFGLDSKVGLNTNLGWLPQEVMVSPYVRYNHAFDSFEPVDNYYYDIGIENDNAKLSDYGYDILIENDDSALLKKREEAKKSENILAEKLGAKGLDVRDDYYDIMLENDLRKDVKRDEQVAGVNEVMTEAAVAALMAGDTKSYNIILNQDAANPADRDKIINEYYNRYQFYEYDKLNDDWLAAQDQNSNAKLDALYGEAPKDENVNRAYAAEETYDGVPIDVELQVSPYAFGMVMYPYRVEFDSDDVPGMIDSKKTRRGVMVYRSNYGLSVSLGMKWRIVNKKDFQFFAGARGMFQLYNTPSFDAYSLFGEVGIGILGINAYIGVGVDFSGAYNKNAGLAFLLGLDYTLKLTEHIGLQLGVNANFAWSKDDIETSPESSASTGYHGGSYVIDTMSLSINPYIGVKVAFDGRTVRYVDSDTTPNKEYKILVDRGDDGLLSDPLDGLTFDDLDNGIESIEF